MSIESTGESEALLAAGKLLGAPKAKQTAIDPKQLGRMMAAGPARKPVAGEKGVLSLGEPGGGMGGWIRCSAGCCYVEK